MIHYVAVLFTPRSLEYRLVGSIISDLMDGVSGLQVLFKERVVLQANDLRIFYPKLVCTEHFPWIVSCFTRGYSEFFLMSGHNVHVPINSLKGKFSFDYGNGSACASGLRRKYRIDTVSFEFLFHSTDSDEETDVMGERLFPERWQSLKG